MKCIDCQLAEISGMHEAVSAMLSAPDSLVDRQLIWSIFAELLERAPECALTKLVLEAVLAKLTCADPNAIGDEEQARLLSWADIWGGWAKALGKWKHKWGHEKDLFDLLADIQIKFDQSIFLFAIQLIAIGECHRAQPLNPSGEEDCDATQAASAKCLDIRNLEKNVFEIKSGLSLLKFRERAGILIVANREDYV